MKIVMVIYIIMVLVKILIGLKTLAIMRVRLCLVINYQYKEISLLKIEELFAKTNDGCFIYSVKVLRNHILDLTNVEHLKNFMQYVGVEEYEEFKEEEYIVDGLPTWDLYPAIEFAKKNSFDGIKLLEFSADISNEPIESILIFDPSNLKIIKKEKT